MELVKKSQQEKIKLAEINLYLTCHLCKGYYIDATTISECLHSFCRSCIIKYLHEHSYCPICDIMINKAKPNLKLDKTLQDIVYKLVPELFLNEMKRRQRFYHSHPDLSTKVTPEERGEDTERTIFNARDAVSLSIEYIRDDSTPGAILIPRLIGQGTDTNNRNKSQLALDNEENSLTKRFLQCPGMCRVEVLKKFICNKYNVDTNQYYIDILYKRVPLPDHYTLIDIAYIYSWKRNEPLKFFFKITDINLVSDTFDYLIQPQINIKLEEPIVDKKRSNKNVLRIETSEKTKRPYNRNMSAYTDIKNEKELEATEIIEDAFAFNPEKEDDLINETSKKLTNLKLNRQQKVSPVKKTNDSTIRKISKNDEYTSITLDRSRNVEIITKVKKVSNKNGLPIGIEVTNHVKKNGPSKMKSEIEPNRSETPPKIIPEIDSEKSNFLKSFELTAKNVLDALSPKKLDLPKTPPIGTGIKRKSPNKSEKHAKKLKKLIGIHPKAIQNPAVWQMVSNVNQNVSNMSKIVEQMTPSSNNDLQTLLYESYKINIPSSLSVTVKNEKDAPTPAPFQKPVQNYIEILKIPDTPPGVGKPNEYKTTPKLTILEKLTARMELNKLETKLEDTPETKRTILPKPDINIKQDDDDKSTPTSSLPSPNPKASETAASQPTITPSTLSPSPPPSEVPNCNITNKETLAKLNPRTPQTFQKMFEEAIKKPEFTSKFQTIPLNKNENNPCPKTDQTAALNLTTDITPPPAGGKRNILAIASKLHKKTKMDQHQEKVSHGTDQPKTTEIPPRKLKPLTVPRPNQQGKSKFPDKGNPPLKDFNSYISSKTPQPQTVTNLHSPTLGLNYTVSVTQANTNVSPKSHQVKVEIDSPRFASKTSPSQPDDSLKPPQKPDSSLRKHSMSPKIPSTPPTKPSSPSIKTSPKSSKLSSPSLNAVTSSSPSESKPLTPNQILEKYNIQNLAQLSANLNFPQNLCMTPANQLAAIHQAMIYRHFEMQNHQNWLNMNPGPLMQYEKYLQSLSKS